MRKLVFLGIVAAAVWWFLSRRRGSAATATVGYADGSSVTLDRGAPELDRLLRIAGEAVGR